MWFKLQQIYAIAGASFREAIRQPVFLLLVTATSCFEIFLATPYYFGFGDEPKLIKNSVLAVMYLSALIGSVLAASSSLAREIRVGTAQTVLSKPVSHTLFFLSKYIGIAGALTLLLYINTVTALIASRMVFDVYGRTDVAALLIFALAVVVAYGIGGLTNYFLRRPFPSDAIIALAVTVTIAAVIIAQFTEQMQSLGEKARVDWRIIPAGLLILFASWMFGAIALTCSTRLDMIPTLAVCSGLFLVGLMSDYLFGRRAEPAWKLNIREELVGTRWTPTQKDILRMLLTKYDSNDSGQLESEELSRISVSEFAQMREAGLDRAWWAPLLYAATPNWQVFWVGDILETEKHDFPWVYVGNVMLYMTLYIGAVLLIGIVLFENKELK